MDLAIFLKQFHYLATPVGLTSALIFLGIICFIFRFIKSARFFIICALTFFWLCASPWFAQSLQAYAASLRPETPSLKSLFKNHTDAQAIVVATWLQPIAPDSDIIYRYLNEKAYNAAQISKELDIPIIVISSQFPPNPEPQDGEKTYAQVYLSKLGVKPGNILITRNQRNTNEAILAAATAIKELNAKKVILVASGSRLTRKYHNLTKHTRKQQVDIIPFSNPYGAFTFKDIKFSSIKLWIPTQQALNSTHSNLHDLLGLAVYHLLGWG